MRRYLTLSRAAGRKVFPPDRLLQRRTRMRLIVPILAFVIAITSLNGCHGGLHVKAQAVITGLDNPTAFTIDPNNNTIWYAERFTGEIRRRNLTTGADTLVYTVTDVRTFIEQGLFGIALHPNYPSTPFVYAYATRNTGFGPINQVLKITLSGGIGTSATPIYAAPLGAGDQHNGGRILFGPDGMLYVITGDHESPANSQNLNNAPGKIHRITDNGAVPAGNPFPGKTIWSYGVRNSFGFDFDPVNGRLWMTDNGPECNDEVQRVVIGGNNGWGTSSNCATPPAAPLNTNDSGPSFRQPEHFYPTTIGITGSAFCGGCGLGTGSENSFFVGAANNGQIHHLTLNGARDDFSSDAMVYDHNSSVLSMETRPGQPIYFSDFGAIYKLVSQ